MYFIASQAIDYLLFFKLLENSFLIAYCLYLGLLIFQVLGYITNENAL